MNAAKQRLKPLGMLLCVLLALSACSRKSGEPTPNGGKAPKDGSVKDAQATDGKAPTNGTPPASGSPDASSTTGSKCAGPQTVHITTNAIRPEEVPPIPPGFEFLYVTGQSTPGWVEVFHVDGETLYWAQNAHIWRAPRDGSGDPEAFGWYTTTNNGSSLFSDETYLYWHDGPHIKRKRKDSPSVSPATRSPERFSRYDNTPVDFAFQEDAEAIALGVNLPLGWLDKDETHIYVAHPDCTPIYKLDLATHEVQVIEFERSGTGGEGALKVDATHVYCGNNRTLFRVKKDGTQAEVLRDDFRYLLALAMAENEVYVFDRWVNTPPHIIRFLKAPGVFADHGQSPAHGFANSYRLAFGFDPVRRRLYWGVTQNWFTVFDLETSRFLTLPDTEESGRTGSIYAIGADVDYLYWAGHLLATHLGGTDNVTILRVHKDCLDELARNGGVAVENPTTLLTPPAVPSDSSH